MCDCTTKVNELFVKEKGIRLGTTVNPATVACKISTSGYIKKNIKLTWVDKPDKKGLYWLSPFVEGRYIRPHTVTVIDYDRPGRGLEVQDNFPSESIPVDIYIKDYYPNAKWTFINEPTTPVIPRTHTQIINEYNALRVQNKLK